MNVTLVWPGDPTLKARVETARRYVVAALVEAPDPRNFDIEVVWRGDVCAEALDARDRHRRATGDPFTTSVIVYDTKRRAAVPR